MSKLSSNYVVCVPSYKREQICKEKTLTMLKNNKISTKKVYVFVANKKEYEIYKKTIPKNMYNKLIIGIKGLIPQRHYIERYFPKDTNIVFLDDDVESVDMSLSNLFKNKTLDYFFKYAFKTCRKENAFIWGVYPVYNPFFREGRKEITTHLSYIVGAFYGVINRPNKKSLKLTLTKKTNGQKEDVERTIKYFIEDEKVVRFNRIGFKTKYYGNVGGLGDFEKRLIPNKVGSEILKKKYPEFGDIKIRKNGVYEFNLKKLTELPKKYKK